ncbi:MAG: PEP-CTERM sorting domain-containing protein [Pseudomonadota bacterium]
MAAVAALGLAGAANATATTLHLDLLGSAQLSGSGAGNARLYNLMDSSGQQVNVRATAFSYSNSGGFYDFSRHTEANLVRYSSGLGVINRFENGSAPGHTADNVGSTDYIVLQFDRQVRVTDLDLSAVAANNNNRVSDADTTLFVGNVDTGFERFIDPTADFGALSTSFALGEGAFSARHGSGIHARQSFAFGANDFGNVVIASADIFRGYGGRDHLFDAFKLKAINFDVMGPGQNVPAPGVLALFGLGLAGIGALRQRRRAAA